MNGRSWPIFVSLACLAVAGVGTVFSPSLLHWFENATGYEGHMSLTRPVAAQPGETGPALSVRLDTNVLPGLDWSFTPEKSVVEVQVGVPTIVYFHVRNLGRTASVGRAIFNVTPDAAAYYFMKTDGFCFKNQRLAPGESARLAVAFYFDKGMLKDAETAETKSMTVSYSYFPMSATPDTVPMASFAAANIQALAPGAAARFTADPDK